MPIGPPFGYILGKRDGIDNWHSIPAALRRSLGRKLAPVRAGSGAIERNIEVRINRRFKRQSKPRLAFILSTA